MTLLDVALWGIGGVLAAVLVHEGAHLLAAALLGGREIRLRLAGGRVQAEAVLDGTRRILAFTLAGPLANLAVAAAIFAPLPEARVVGAMSLLLAVGSLVPTGTSDGARALALLRPGG